MTSVTSSANAEAGNASATTMTASSFTGRGPRVQTAPFAVESRDPSLIESLRVKTALVRGFLLLLLVAGAALASAGQAATTSGNRVLAVEFENDVNPVTRGLRRAADRPRRTSEHYNAVVILLDTPGGLVSSMEDIVKAELASKVPVIVYVSPEGASATSAGAFIAEAGDLLAMAPQTTIGSSTPVGSGGENLPPTCARRRSRSSRRSSAGSPRTTAGTRTWANGRCAAATAGRPRRPSTRTSPTCSRPTSRRS